MKVKRGDCYRGGSVCLVGRVGMVGRLVVMFDGKNSFVIKVVLGYGFITFDGLGNKVSNCNVGTYVSCPFCGVGWVW